MELDELKKSWNAMDKKLQQENIVNEKQIAELIAKYQAGATRGINKLTDLQKSSVFIGIAFVIVAAVILMVETSFFRVMNFSPKVVVLVSFVALTIIGGLYWDIRTYRFSRNTKVDEMSTVEVVERMNVFSRWLKCEVVIITAWIVLFFMLYYWAMNFYEQPLHTQLIFIGFSLIFVSTIMYIMYKKLIYRYLNEVKKNLKELKELENDPV